MGKRIGIIGLGKMGLPMARHLLAGGHAVAGHDVAPGAMEAAAALGVTPCDTPAAAARDADLVIVVVGFETQVRDALRGEDGVLAGLPDGATIAIAATLRPGTMQEIEAELAGRQAGLLDIPICRGEPAAEAGTLLLLGGGDAALFERHRDAFGCFASDIHHLGPLGAGQVGKLVNNLLLWATITANDEGLRLGAALGVDPEALRAALLKSSGANWALETWDRPRTMPWAEKDMGMVMEEAARAGLDLPVCNTVRGAIAALKKARGLPTPEISG